MRGTYTRTAGVRHLFAAYELGEDRLYGHIKPRKNRTRFLEFCRYLRFLYPAGVRIAIVCGNFSPHLTTRKDKRVGQWAAASNVEIACTPTKLIRRYIIWGNNHACDERLRRVVDRASVA